MCQHSQTAWCSEAAVMVPKQHPSIDLQPCSPCLLLDAYVPWAATTAWRAAARWEAAYAQSGPLLEHLLQLLSAASGGVHIPRMPPLATLTCQVLHPLAGQQAQVLAAPEFPH